MVHSFDFYDKKAALIDMDGVLYDSMPSHAKAWKRLMDELDIPCSADEIYLYEGMTGKATIDLLIRRKYGCGVSEERARELYEIKARYFREDGARPVMHGASRMLDALDRLGLKRVLVTGSGQTSLLDALDYDYPGVFPAECRVTAHDVTKGKPDPEPYIKGAAKVGVAPENCVVVENAPLGVRAGKAAGCTVFAVTTGPVPRHEFELAGADIIFPSMEEFAAFLEDSVRNGHILD